MTKINLDERLRDKEATFKAAGRAVQDLKTQIWWANLDDLKADRAAEIDAFRADYPLADSERASVGRLLDAFEPKWDRSYENLVAMLR